VDGTDSCTCEHCNGKLPYHRQIDGNPVALSHSSLFQNIGKLGYVCKHIFVSKFHNIIFRLTLEQNSYLVSPAFLYLCVEAVIGNIGLAADKPLYLAL